MPRVQPRLLRAAYSVDTLLARLLPVCRELRSAKNELRWLKAALPTTVSSAGDKHNLLGRWISRRSRGEPLQYILGSEYFGPLEIQCRPGVLIPRQETASAVQHLVRLLSTANDRRQLPGTLRVLDLCTGTGCIPLLFHHDFYAGRQNQTTLLELCGIDISPTAINLAQLNHNIQLKAQRPTSQPSPRQQALQTMRFLQADILLDNPTTATDNDLTPHNPPSLTQALALAQTTQTTTTRAPTFDLLICNPPYISPKSYTHTTAPSVRHYEPKLALVPPDPTPEQNNDNNINTNTPTNKGDTFYPSLLSAAQNLQAQIVLLEVADLSQAKRVAGLALEQKLWDGVEIWRDEPGVTSEEEEETEVAFGGERVEIKGMGKGRVVVGWRGTAGRWLGKV